MSKSVLDPANFPQSVTNDEATVLVRLQYNPLDIASASKFVRSPTAGANVLFLGTTRNNFDGRPVARLSYQAYPNMALNTLLKIGTETRAKHGLEKVIIIHRLGEVPVEEESIIVAVSSGHRGECWKGAEETLERVKERAEIWKREWFADTRTEDGANEEEGVWKANRDTDASGNPVGVHS